MLEPHPWNTDPLPQPRYRLTVVHQRNPDKKLEAVSASREALHRLEAELACLEYDFVRVERLN